LSGVFHVDEVMIRVGKEPIRKYAYDFEIIWDITDFGLKKYHKGVKPKMRGWGISGFRKD